MATLKGWNHWNWNAKHKLQIFTKDSLLEFEVVSCSFSSTCISIFSSNYELLWARCTPGAQSVPAPDCTNHISFFRRSVLTVGQQVNTKDATVVQIEYWIYHIIPSPHPPSPPSPPLFLTQVRHFLLHLLSTTLTKPWVLAVCQRNYHYRIGPSSRFISPKCPILRLSGLATKCYVDTANDAWHLRNDQFLPSDWTLELPKCDNKETREGRKFHVLGKAVDLRFILKTNNN